MSSNATARAGIHRIVDPLLRHRTGRFLTSELRKDVAASVIDDRAPRERSNQGHWRTGRPDAAVAAADQHHRQADFLGGLHCRHPKLPTRLSSHRDTGAVGAHRHLVRVDLAHVRLVAASGHEARGDCEKKHEMPHCDQRSRDADSAASAPHRTTPIRRDLPESRSRPR